MKILFSLALILLLSGIGLSQTLTMGNSGYISHTMKTVGAMAPDTLSVDIGGLKYKNYYTVLAVSTISDSVFMDVKTADTLWTQQALLDLSTGSNVVGMYITTTPRLFQILDPQPKKLRFRTLGTDSANVLIIVESKYKP